MTQLQAMLLSMAIEVACLVALARVTRWSDASVLRLVLVGVAATGITHPFVWHLTPAMAPWIPNWWGRVAITEVGAILMEAAVFAALLALPAPRALTTSAAANGASFGVGLVWFLGLQPWLTSSANPCPPGFHPDAHRAEQVAALVGHDVAASLCFGAVAERGLRDPAGRFRLDAEADPALLAARVVHLERHLAPNGQGEACLEQLRREEAEAWAAELRHRGALGVHDPQCPVETSLGPAPTAQAVEAWLEAASAPRARELGASHRERCGLPR